MLFRSSLFLSFCNSILLPLLKHRRSIQQFHPFNYLGKLSATFLLRFEFQLNCIEAPSQSDKFVLCDNITRFLSQVLGSLSTQMPKLGCLFDFKVKNVLLQSFLLESHQLKEFCHLPQRSQSILDTLNSKDFSCFLNLSLP